MSTSINILIGVLAVVVPFVIARRERRTKQLTYVTVSSGRIIPDVVADRWSVIADGVAVPGACTTTVRVVVTGSQAILPSDFITPLKLEMEASDDVVTVTVTRRRPSDLAITTAVDRHCVTVEPVLLNSGDMFEMQALTSSVVSAVNLRGRIADTVFVSRRSLPYPPGSGREGELVGFDRFMWYVAPILLGALFSSLVVTSESSLVSKVVGVAGIAVLVLVANLLLVRELDRRRGLWRT